MLIACPITLLDKEGISNSEQVHMQLEGPARTGKLEEEAVGSEGGEN